MLTLVQIRSASTSSAAAASLVADYLSFDRRRTARRQYMKAFGGMALLVLLGALFGRVAGNEAGVVIGLLLAPPMLLAAVEFVQWHRLVRRLDGVRTELREVRKS
jgi:purine-cytosine permease-like protein